MKKCVCLFLLLLYCLVSYSQEQDSIRIVYPRYRTTKDVSLFTGFVMSGRDKVSTRGFEVGVIKDHATFLASVGYYASSEFLFNSNGFLMGPKIGGYASFFIGCVGSELVFYNDFKSSSIHFVPYAGLGFAGARLTVGPHIPLYNKEFKGKRYFSINISINIFNISEKKYYWKDR